MVFPIKIKIEWIIIAVLAAVIFLRGCGEDEPVLAETTETKTIQKAVTEVDSSFSAVNDLIPKKIKIIERPGAIEIVGTSRDLSLLEKSKAKPANRYRDTTYFEHARVFSDIISEGRILRKNLIVETDHLETTTTTTKTTVKNAGGLFVSPALGYSPVFGIESIETNLTYIKGGFGIGAGAFYNLQNKHAGFKLSVYFKLTH